MYIPLRPYNLHAVHYDAPSNIFGGIKTAQHVSCRQIFTPKKFVQLLLALHFGLLDLEKERQKLVCPDFD